MRDCGKWRLALWALTAAAAPLQGAMAQDRIDPCAGYQVYASTGGGDTGPAQALKRVCKITGPRQISQACLIYYTRKTASYPKYAPEDLASDAQACAASMPGEVPKSECGGGAECAPAPVPVAVPAADAGSDCGADGLECAPVPDPEPLGSDDSPAGSPAPAPAQAGSDALDLAFWEAIKDSDNPVLYQAYLDKFPDGTFAPIAREWLRTSGATGSGGAGAAPTPAPSATPPVGNDPDGARALARANRIMDEAYASDSGDWDAAARLAFPLYEDAAAKGQAGAWLAMGELYEAGLGAPVDNDRAVAAYRRAGGLGLNAGYDSALVLLDQLADDARFVPAFLEYYRSDQDLALATLNDLGRDRSRAVQARLRDEGYYTGALDGAFGPASQHALAAYMSGAPRPPAPGPAPQPSAAAGTLTADIQRELARVGCYHGPIDGKWGPATAQAMENYNDWSGDNGDTTGPTEHALQLVTIALGPLCGVD